MVKIEHFLKKLGSWNVENYILELRHTIKRNILFLKRLPSEMRINNCNIYTITESVEGKHGYAICLRPLRLCNLYFILYITKGQRDISRLLEKIY